MSETPPDATPEYTTRPTHAEVLTQLSRSGLDVHLTTRIYRAEVAAQNARCVTEPYNAALGYALVRRVERAIEMRNLILGVSFDAEGHAARVSSNDPEVRRLEAPHRKVLIG